MNIYTILWITLGAIAVIFIIWTLASNLFDASPSNDDRSRGGHASKESIKRISDLSEVLFFYT